MDERLKFVARLLDGSERQIIAIEKEHPAWGARKIREVADNIWRAKAVGESASWTMT